MKITKARLKEIIKEEIEEAVGVYGNPRMAELPGPDRFGRPIKKEKPRRKTQAELPGDMYKKMLIRSSPGETTKMKVAGRGTQVEEPSTKVKEFLDIIASANMTSKEKEELMKALGADL